MLPQPASADRLDEIARFCQDTGHNAFVLQGDCSENAYTVTKVYRYPNGPALSEDQGKDEFHAYLLRIIGWPPRYRINQGLPDAIREGFDEVAALAAEDVEGSIVD